MSLLDDIKGLSNAQFAAGFALFLATIAPGSLILLQFRPDLLEHLESIKVLIISVGLTSPLLFANTFLVRHKDRDKYALPFSVGISAFVTSVVLYLALLICYLCRLRFTYFVGIVGLLEVSIIVYTTLKYGPNKPDQNA